MLWQTVLTCLMLFVLISGLVYAIKGRPPCPWGCPACGQCRQSLHEELHEPDERRSAEQAK